MATYSIDTEFCIIDFIIDVRLFTLLPYRNHINLALLDYLRQVHSLIVFGKDSKVM